MLAAADHVRDAGVGVEHLERLDAHPLELGVAEAGQRRLVAGAHPIQRLLAGDVLEPQVGVVLGGGIGAGVRRHASHCGRGGSVRCSTQVNEG